MRGRNDVEEEKFGFGEKDVALKQRSLEMPNKKIKTFKNESEKTSKFISISFYLSLFYALAFLAYGESILGPHSPEPYAIGYGFLPICIGYIFACTARLIFRRKWMSIAGGRDVFGWIIVIVTIALVPLSLYLFMISNRYFQSLTSIGNIIADIIFITMMVWIIRLHFKKSHSDDD